MLPRAQLITVALNGRQSVVVGAGGRRKLNSVESFLFLTSITSSMLKRLLAILLHSEQKKIAYWVCAMKPLCCLSVIYILQNFKFYNYFFSF